MITELLIWSFNASSDVVDKTDVGDKSDVGDEIFIVMLIVSF